MSGTEVYLAFCGIAWPMQVLAGVMRSRGIQRRTGGKDGATQIKRKRSEG
jgi:hypothetical protein